MRELGNTLGIPLFVFGPETHMTSICGMALGKRPIPQSCSVEFATANFLLPGGQQQRDQAADAKFRPVTAEPIGKHGIVFVIGSR